jgi:hypothetical protein
MLEFLFPWSMVAGGILISSPIIIHLINRMRFKRVRWAAMEFLLKSQKRNRRKLIIEQLILLLLRCLLVALIGLIVARFLGFNLNFFKPQNRHHVVLLDDTASMNDQWKEERSGLTTSFKEGKRLIVEEIAKHAGQAANLQKFKVVRITNPDEVVFRTDVLNEETRKELGNKLQNAECTALHVDLLKSVERARKLFEETPQDQNILYVVSDFRHNDWSGSAREQLNKQLQAMSDKDKGLGVQVKFVDVAHPARKETEAGYHPNLAITRLQPETAIVGQNMPMTEFTVAVANYGPTVRENVQVKVRLDGVEQLQSSVPFPSIQPRTVMEQKFRLYLDKVGLNQVVAYLPEEDEGLNLDNTRYAVVEVKERVPVLVVDGDLTNSKKEGGDLFFLQVIFQPSASYDIVPGYKLESTRPDELEKMDLNQYPNIYLVNVPDLNEKAKANLEAYVKQGGTVCFVMGDKVKADFYNTQLYADGKGVFPVPLADRPTPELNEKDRDAREELNRMQGAQPRFFLRKKPSEHPFFADELMRIAGEKGFFQFMYVDRYYPVPREKWSPLPGRSDELLTLANSRPIDDYKTRVQNLLAKIPVNDAKYKKYRDSLMTHHNTVRDMLAGTSLVKLAEAIDGLLNDTGEHDPKGDKVNLREFWEQEEVKKLGEDFARTAESVRYGDPLLVEAKYGKGRSVVLLTSIGKKWNNWAEIPLYPMILNDLQRYLKSTTADAERTVGSSLDVDLDASRYKGALKVFYKPEAKDRGPGVKGGKGDLEEISREELAISGAPKGRLQFHVNLARKPGVYVFELAGKKADGTDETEQRAFAFNIDASESNLLRAGRDTLEEASPTVKIYTLGSDRFTDLADKQSDLSEGPWLFLAFLILLIAEQALAVHLSFHLHGQPAAPAPRPAAV